MSNVQFNDYLLQHSAAQGIYSGTVQASRPSKKEFDSEMDAFSLQRHLVDFVCKSSEQRNRREPSSHANLQQPVDLSTHLEKQPNSRVLREVVHVPTVNLQVLQRQKHVELPLNYQINAKN